MQVRAIAKIKNTLHIVTTSVFKGGQNNIAGPLNKMLGDRGPRAPLAFFSTVNFTIPLWYKTPSEFVVNHNRKQLCYS